MLRRNPALKVHLAEEATARLTLNSHQLLRSVHRRNHATPSHVGLFQQPAELIAYAGCSEIGHDYIGSCKGIYIPSNPCPTGAAPASAPHAARSTAIYQEY